jgi:hypothetical protein
MSAEDEGMIGDEGDATGAVADAEPEERDPLRGYVGWVYQDLFEELYNQPQLAKADGAPDDTQEPAADGGEPPAADGEGEGAEGDATLKEAPDSAFDELDLSEEDNAITMIQEHLDAEKGRISRVQEYLNRQQTSASQKDKEEAEFLLNRWGLTIREQIPMPESKLRGQLDAEALEAESLLVPDKIMLDMEHRIAIETGVKQKHTNLLSVSKPEEPNYFKATGCIQNRLEARKIKPRLTEEQRQLLGEMLAERKKRRPPMPPMLNAEERNRNREIIRRMQTKVSFLKNPRFTADRKAAEKGEVCPFWITPAQVVFRNYEVGSVYEIRVEFRNTTRVGRRLRVLPSNSEVFSTTVLKYEGDAKRPVGAEPSSVVAPGMAAFLTVRFAPTSLNDQDEALTVATEMGDYPLPVMARRVQPQLDFEEPVNCGCILAGQTTSVVVPLTNRGGEGSFRFITDGDAQVARYDTDDEGGTTFVCGSFSIKPAQFYLEADKSVDITVHFSAPQVGQHTQPVLVEGDNGERTQVTLIAITDALRLEMLRWPTLPSTVAPVAAPAGISPWSLVPWQLRWLNPGVQVGCKESQEVTIANGGYLPITVHWKMAKPPKAYLTKLAVGGMPRLTDAMLQNITHWETYSDSKLGSPSCPFTVSPLSIRIDPFETANFTFTYSPSPPVTSHSSAFAYLVAEDLPASGHCLLPYERLLGLQDSMQPEEYQKGLPLFGNQLFQPSKSTKPTNKEMESPVKHCVTTSVCLQGICTGPKLSLMPPLLAFCGDTAPFVSHTREVVLRNTGTMPARFRVRLSSVTQPSGADDYPPLYITSEQEVGACPVDQRSQPVVSKDPKEQLRNWAEWLDGQWPPLPPDPPMEAQADGSKLPCLPGAGALATVVCRPSTGIMKPGETLKVQVTMRAVRECDIDALLLVDLPTNEGDPHPCDTPPLKIRILSAVRSPRPEMSNTSLLDFGVVRAHARHAMTVHVRNPSSIPTLVRLEHLDEAAYHEDEDDNKEVEIRQHASTPVGQIEEDSAAPAHVPADLTARSSKSSAGTASPRGGVGAAATVGRNPFPFTSHKQVVAHLISEINRDVDSFANPVIEPQDEDDIEPWVHARSGCLDRSGRKAYRGRLGVGEVADEEEEEVGEEAGDEELDPDVMFVFRPGWVLVPPQSTMPVEVTLRAKGVEKYETFLKVMGFDSLASQCVEVIAEVQLPHARLSETSVHYPVTYVKTASDPRSLRLINDSDMPAPFRWKIPPGLGAGLEVTMDHTEGVIPPRSEKEIALVLIPTKSQAGRVEVECYAYIGDIIQPLTLRVSARVYGLQVDYAVVLPTELEPEIDYEPRASKAGDESEEEDPNQSTWAVEGNHPSKNAPPVNFGDMQLQDTKTLRLILYNRSGIATPFSAKMMRYPAYDPATKGKKLGKLLGAATRMAAETSPDETLQEPPTQIHSNEPKQVTDKLKGTGGKSKGLKADGSTGGPRKFLLDDKHEKQAFRSTTGAEFAKQKELREQGAVALNYGRGYAVKLVPSNGWLHPFGKAEIVCTCYSDLPGAMMDDMMLAIKNMQGPDFHLPVRLASHGNPLYLPDQQVALSQHYTPPRLSCGTIVPVEQKATRRFKVGNNSATNIHVSWKVFPQRQIENSSGERQFVNIALCNKPEREVDELEEEDKNEENEEEEDDFGFMMWANEPPDIKDPFSLPGGDPPVKIEPMHATLPKHGTACFTVTMNASKTTTTAAGHYHYKLVGKGRYARDGKGDDDLLADGRRASKDGSGSKRGSKDKAVTLQDTAVLRAMPAGTLSEEVAMLPDVPLEIEELDENDSDLEDLDVILSPQPSKAPTKEVEEAAQDGGSKTGSKAPSKRSSPTQGLEDDPATLLSDEPDQDVVSTLVIDTLGDCILPRLTVDKKPDPSVEEVVRHEDADDGEILNCPVFKFEHSAIAANIPDDQLPIGTVVTGGGLDSPNQGVTLCLVRQITLSNEHACNVSCRFRLEGPFRIRQISQVGKTTVRPKEIKTRGKHEKARFLENPYPELFTLGWKQTISVQVQFVPELVDKSQWKDASDNTFHGELYVEYPRDSVDSGDTMVKPDIQRIHLKGTSRRPSVMISVIPLPEIDPKALKRANEPEWGPPPPELVEFGYVHVESGIARHRTILLSNETNVIAKWKLLHVGRKKKVANDIGMTCRELEELGALDEPSAFSFDIVAGCVEGPTKVQRTWDQIDKELNTKKLAEQTAGKEGGGRRGKKHDGNRPADKRTPSWYPSTSALPHSLPHRDEEKYMPARVNITFQPKKNELYKCRFRLQVDGGRNVDFICRGCGSYDEEDDVMELYES